MPVEPEHSATVDHRRQQLLIAVCLPLLRRLDDRTTLDLDLSSTSVKMEVKMAEVAIDTGTGTGADTASGTATGADTDTDTGTGTDGRYSYVYALRLDFAPLLGLYNIHLGQKTAGPGAGVEVDLVDSVEVESDRALAKFNKKTRTLKITVPYRSID